MPSVSDPKPLPHRHSATPWSLHSKRVEGVLVDGRLHDATGRDLADCSDEQTLVNYERVMRCVNACELLHTDDPMREIEALQRDRAHLLAILARAGVRRTPGKPDVVLHPGSDIPAEHESITEPLESKHVIAEDGRVQIGPLDT